MRTTLPKSVALLAVALLCAPPAFAQVRSDSKPVPAKSPAPVAVPVAPKPPAPPVAPSPPGFSTIAPVPATAAPRKLSVLQIPLSELAVAVEILQRALEDNGLEQLNILFGPDTKEQEVSGVVLRNVTGPDALQLIAAAAGCTVEPMYSTESQTPPGLPVLVGVKAPVIGYQLRGKPKPATPVRVAPMSVGGFPSSSVPVAGNPPALPGMPGRMASAASTAGRLTRIYPLGAVTAATKFPDLEKTLRDIFKADNVAENQVSLALHEKTNVLVVNAAEQVHVLVEQLLTALNTNTSQAERLSTTRDRAMGREELEAAARAKARLEHEVAERDAQLRELQKELRKLQDAAQKPPSAK